MTLFNKIEEFKTFNVYFLNCAIIVIIIYIIYIYNLCFDKQLCILIFLLMFLYYYKSFLYDNNHSYKFIMITILSWIIISFGSSITGEFIRVNFFKQDVLKIF